MIIEPKPADPDKRVPGALYVSPVLKQFVPLVLKRSVAAEMGVLVGLSVQLTAWDGRTLGSQLIEVPRLNMWNAAQMPWVTVGAVYEQEATE